MAYWLAAIGSTSHHMGFNAVAADWPATLKTDYDYKSAIIRKFLIPYFHDYKGRLEQGAKVHRLDAGSA
jgi:hypothetical protein